jgi:hypothetical protein
MFRFLPILITITFFSCQDRNPGEISTTANDTTKTTKIDTSKKVKFTMPIEYDKFIVDSFIGKKITIDYSINKTARRFRSAIKWSIDKFAANFGGHYNLARWGCGTTCINGAITNLKTGKVYDLPPATIDYDFRNNSILLVINPPDSTGYYDYAATVNLNYDLG